jgi:hypothetical protein
MFVSANKRALSTVEISLAMETVRATLFQTSRKFVGVLTLAQSTRYSSSP